LNLIIPIIPATIIIIPIIPATIIIIPIISTIILIDSLIIRNMSTKPDTFKHPKASFDRLTDINYTSWRIDMRRVLRSIGAWRIIMGEETEPDEDAAADVKQKYIERTEDAAACIYDACTKAIKRYIEKTDDPKEMWDTLKEKLDTAKTSTGRQQIHQRFLSTKPTPGAPIGDFFTELKHLQGQISGTEEAISDTTFKTHIISCLPPNFEMPAKIKLNDPTSTVDTIIQAILEDERLQSMRTQTDATSEALITNAAGRKKWCEFCERATHTTDQCWSKKSKKKEPTTPKRRRAGTPEDASNTCFYCGENGHLAPKCPVKQKAMAARAPAQPSNNKTGGSPEKPEGF
jgi:hypothetical protein